MPINRPRSWLRVSMLALAAVFCVAVSPSALPAETLRALVAQSAVPPDAGSLPNAERHIVGYSVLDTADWFAVAYYLEGASNALEEPLFVDRYDRKAREWRSATFGREQRRAGEGDCLGTVVGLEAAMDSFLLATHINPSAQCLLVLSTRLEFRTTLYGWPLASLSDGSIVYHRSQIHFGAVHAAEIAFYNRKTGRSYTIYPSKPFQAVRQAEVTKMAAFFDANEAWCSEHNHPCDPEHFDNALAGGVVVNDPGDAMAFTVNYGSDPQDAGMPPVAAGQRKVVYVFRWVRNEYAFQYREMLQKDVTARFGGIGLAGLLTSERLRQIFGN